MRDLKTPTQTATTITQIVMDIWHSVPRSYQFYLIIQDQELYIQNLNLAAVLPYVGHL